MLDFVRRGVSQIRPVASDVVEMKVMEIADLAAMQDLTSGLGPSLPHGCRVHLTFLAERNPERGRMEAQLSRHAQACGCEAAGVVVVFVLAVLAAAQFLFDIHVALPGFPVYVSWVVIAVAIGILAKISFLYYAKRQMHRLYVSALALMEDSST
jgi:sterol desaturase/sphingolipid hydroxylase (fatty acid hydroxylase superfamily)